MRPNISNNQTPQPSAFFYGYIIVFVTFIIATTVDGLTYSFGIFFEPLLKEFGWTRATISGAFSLTAFIRIPIAIVAGMLSDRFGSKRVLVTAGIFIGLGYVLMSHVSAVWQIYLSYGILVGTGVSLYWVPLIAIIPRWFVKRRALMMGVVASGVGAGQLIIPPTASWLISGYGWRTASLIIGGACTAIITIAAQFLKNAPEQMGLLPDGESTARQGQPFLETRVFSVKEVIFMKRFWLFCLVYLPWLFCLSTVAVHIVIHAIGLGASQAGAANIFVIIGVVGIIGRLISGRLADEAGMKPVLIISFVLMSLAFLWLIIARELWMIYLFALIFGISYGTFEIMQSPLIAELFGLSSVGTVFGAALSISTIGFILGPITAGYIFDITGSYLIAFIICAIMALVCLTSTVFLPLTGTKRSA